MCLSCCDADKKAMAKEGEFCIGKVSFGELVRDLIQEWKETKKTSYNILKEAVPDFPASNIIVKAEDADNSAELKIAFV